LESGLFNGLRAIQSLFSPRRLSARLALWGRECCGDWEYNSTLFCFGQTIARIIFLRCPFRRCGEGSESDALRLPVEGLWLFGHRRHRGSAKDKESARRRERSAVRSNQPWSAKRSCYITAAILVIPAQAGIATLIRAFFWMPAFAGMTESGQG